MNDLFTGLNVGQGFVLLVPAILGKWLSGAWAADLRTTRCESQRVSAPSLPFGAPRLQPR